MGKSTISMAMFKFAKCHHQRLHHLTAYSNSSMDPPKVENMSRTSPSHRLATWCHVRYAKSVMYTPSVGMRRFWSGPHGGSSTTGCWWFRREAIPGPAELMSWESPMNEVWKPPYCWILSQDIASTYGKWGSDRRI